MYNKTTRKIISAKEVSIRKFNDGKCNLVYNGECIFDRFPKNLITKEDADLPFLTVHIFRKTFAKAWLRNIYILQNRKTIVFR